MLKLLGDKCICFCAGENPEFPLTIQRGVNLTTCSNIHLSFLGINVSLFSHVI